MNAYSQPSSVLVTNPGFAERLTLTDPPPHTTPSRGSLT